MSCTGIFLPGRKAMQSFSKKIRNASQMPLFKRHKGMGMFSISAVCCCNVSGEYHEQKSFLCATPCKTRQARRSKAYLGEIGPRLCGRNERADLLCLRLRRL